MKNVLNEGNSSLQGVCVQNGRQVDSVCMLEHNAQKLTPLPGTGGCISACA